MSFGASDGPYRYNFFTSVLAAFQNSFKKKRRKALIGGEGERAILRGTLHGISHAGRGIEYRSEGLIRLAQANKQAAPKS